MSKPNNLGGKKYKKKKKTNFNKERKLEEAETGQVYGKVIKKIGGDFIELVCNDGQIRKGHIRGKMRKREWLNENDIVLCTLNSFGTDIKNKDKCTIEMKYRIDEINTLKSQGKLNFGDSEDDKLKIFENEVTVEKKQSISFDDIVKPLNNNSDINDDVTNADDFFGESENTLVNNNNDYDINDLLDML